MWNIFNPLKLILMHIKHMKSKIKLDLFYLLENKTSFWYKDSIPHSINTRIMPFFLCFSLDIDFFLIN